jgi:hypothetical protein|tara:strand:+ start:4978 stop:6645 length:1668 start_codon:yes stop_codon:yes gene_type:complete
MTRIGVAWLLAILAACGPPRDPLGSGDDTWFVEQAGERGLTFEYRSGFKGRPLLPEIVGGGAALADVDGDGDLDAYLVQSDWRLDGGREARFKAAGNQLFHNLGDGRFAAVPDDGSHKGYGMGVAAGDYDNDGDVDFYITNVGPNALLRNDGQGRFEDVATMAGVAHDGWGTAAAFLDLDVDGDLDLFLVNYIDWSLKIERDCFARSKPTYCSPTTYQASAMDRLLRNNGDGTFRDVSVEAGLTAAYGNGLGLVAADFDGDGLTDVFVANDKTVDQLWLNKGDLNFVDEAAAWGCAVDEHGIAKAGMGVGAGDVDNDGDVDLVVVNLEGETDSFFRNEGGYFADATATMGLATSSRYTRFGVALADFDNDGWLDLYEANGKVDGDITAGIDPFKQPNVLYRGIEAGLGYRFQSSSSGGGVSLPLVHTSRGVAIGDVDDDGGLDLLVVNRDGPAYLLMNRAERGNWVRFRVLSRGRDAHGATVSASVGTNRLQREVRPASSYLASSDPRVHFGLGAATVARDVRVRWPGNEEESFGDFTAGTTAELRRGDGHPGKL